MRSIEDKGCYNKHGQIQEISSSSSISFEFHKVNGTTRPSHHNHNHTHNHNHNHTHTHMTALGKPTPSKWDDAHKWLAGLSRGGVDKKQSISITQPRNSNADDRRLIAPAPQHEEEDPDFSSQLVNASYKVETKKIDCDESVWRINKHNHDHEHAIAIANDATIPIRSICLRDMGTEMTPIASQEPSRTATPIRATTPVGRSPITSGPSTPDRSCQNPSANAPAVDDLPRHCGQLSNGPKINNPLETRALAWDEAERDKYMARYKHEEVKIQAWETHQKRKAEMEMKKMEAKAERMKARAQEKLTNKLAATKRIAEEKRANAEAKLNEDAMKTQESADYIRRTGHMPCSFSFKMPSLCW